MAKLINKVRIAKAVKKAKTKFELAHETAQKNAALPIEQGGLGLPPDNTAMDRARAMGFDETIFYHGTGSDIEAFDPRMAGKNDRGLWGRGQYLTTTPESASSYALREDDGANVIQAYVSAKNPMMVTTGKDLITRMPDGTNTKSLIGDNLDGSKIKEIAESSGHDGVFQVKPNGNIGDIVLYDPKNIRSRFAAFDPMKRNSPNLLASAGAGIGAGVLYTPEENQAQAGIASKTVNELADNLKNIDGVKTLNLYETSNGDIKLDTLIVDKDKRNSGIGSNVMQEINAFADQNGKRVLLTPAVKDDFQGTTSRGRLVKYYKRHGFVENKGRNKDFSISEGMIREPQKGQADPRLLAGLGLGAGAAMAASELTTRQKAERARLSRMTRKQQLADVTKRALGGLTEIPVDLAKYAHDIANFGAGIFSTADLLGGAAAIPYEMTGNLEAYQRDVQPYVQQANETQSAGFRKLEDMAGKVIETAITATAPAWYPAYQQWSPIIGNAMEDFYYPNADQYDR